MITKDNAAEFIKSYEMASSCGRQEFKFDGERVLTAYAKYVVEYLRSLGC